MAGTVPDHKVEFFLNSAWVSASVFNSEPVKLTSGRSPESSTAVTSSLAFALPNTDGRYSSKNPLGIYYGQFKRGVPCRFSVDTSVMRMVSPVSAGAFDTTHRANTPDAASLDIAGDLDLRVERSGRFDGGILIAKTNAYYLSASTQGVLRFQWYDASAVIRGYNSTDVAPTHERYAYRAVLDVDNGAGGSTVTFYTSPTIGGTWTQLGLPIVTAAGVTSIRNSLEGACVGGGSDSFTYKGQILNGISGTIVANPDFTIQSEGATSFADSTGKTWTLGGRSTVSRWSTRFSGYVSELEPTWDLSQQVATMTVTASGVLRRLLQSGTADHSSYYKGMFARNPIAYWPMEDDVGSTTLAAATNGTPAMTFGSTATLANSSVFVASRPLPTDGTFFTASVQPGYANPNTEIQFRYLMQVPAGLPVGTVISRIRTDGTLNRFDVAMDTTFASNIVIIAYSDNVAVAQLGPFNLSTKIGVPVRWSIELKQVGTGVQYNLVELGVGDTSGGTFGPAIVPLQTLGRATAVGVVGFTGSVIGHMSVENAISPIFDLAQVLNAYVGEQAATRVARLALAAGVDQEQIGSAQGSAMGIEPISDLVSKLQQCVDADDGILFESRAFPGLYYREREDVYSQPPSLRVSYGSLRNDTVPAEDDQLLTNDWTISRDSGSSARYQLATGALSVQDSPNGVGRYADSATLNLNNDGQLIGHAAWRVHLGTVDDVRFPTVSLDMHSPYLSGSLVSVLDLQIGDWLAITGPPLWFPPYEVQQQIFQVVETMTAETYNVTLSAGRPARAQRVGVADTPLARLDTGGSHIGLLNSTTNSFAVATDTGPVWVQSGLRPQDFPFNIVINGEVMTVNTINGGGTTQVFGVTRSVNGVVRSHPALSLVSLAEPSYWGI